MPTNDEIVNKMNWTMASEVIKDGKGLVSIRLNLNAMLNEARADTSKQIFNEIDEYVYVTGLSVKDKKADWFKEKYEALKKKYNIEA